MKINMDEEIKDEAAGTENVPAVPTESTKNGNNRIKQALPPFLAALFFALLFFQYYAYHHGGYGKPAGNPSGSVQDVSDRTLSDKLAAESKIKKFDSYSDLGSFLEDNTGNSGYGGMTGMANSLSFNEAAPAPAVAKDAQSASGGSAAEYSRTNVQVAGVDEADLVKTDGQYVYSVSGKTLYITKAYPADSAAVEAKIEFKSYPQEIYLQGDRLAIFGSDQDIMTMDYYRSFKRHSPYSFFKVFDISDRRNPQQIRDLDFEGSYLNSRMIGDYVYFLTSTYGQYYPGEPLVPRILDGGKELYDAKDAASCQSDCPPVYYFDMPYDSVNMVDVAAININDASEKPTSQVYLTNGSGNFYASQHNLYITYTKYLSEYDLFIGVARDFLFSRLPANDQERIAKIEAVDRSILTDQEKMSKIGMVIERYLGSLDEGEQQNLQKELGDAMQQKYTDISKELEKTVIHKIAIAGKDIEYKSSGEVTGSVLNQFSMDEDDQGDFRVATTKDRQFGIMPLYLPGVDELKSGTGSTTVRSDGTTADPNQSYANVYVLDNDLRVIGSAEKLAPGERIYAARFMQDRAYLVTYQQVDPLFVIDLSDGKNPKVLGELKLPGFSQYLEPYDNDTLIGLGQMTETTDYGASVPKGLKLSLFDVSDVAHPREVDKYELGAAGSYSPALNDHRAFLFSREKNLIAFPVTLTNKLVTTPMSAQEMFNGAVVFAVDQNGFKLRGKVSQNLIDKDSNIYNYDSGIKRVLYIDNDLYTVSDQYLQINELDNLSTLKRVPLAGEADFRVVNPGIETDIAPSAVPVPAGGSAASPSVVSARSESAN